MIDISDGLSADVFHLCEESSCGVVLFAANIPISEAARQLHDDKTPLEHALGDGEDFELAFAVDPVDGERLLRTQPIPGVTLTHIGVFVEETALFLEDGGQAARRIELRARVRPQLRVIPLAASRLPENRSQGLVGCCTASLPS